MSKETTVEAVGTRGAKGHFSAGNRANPGGRPKKDRAFAALAQQYLEAKNKEQRVTRGQLLIAALYKQGVDGNVPAAKELLDRAYGKVAQRHEFDVDDVRAEARRLAKELGLDEDAVLSEAEEIIRGGT